jgi:hypothetical protein
VRSFGASAFEWCGDYSREGVDYEFAATAQMDDGRTYRDKEQVFVAAHDGNWSDADVPSIGVVSPATIPRTKQGLQSSFSGHLRPAVRGVTIAR